MVRTKIPHCVMSDTACDNGSISVKVEIDIDEDSVQLKPILDGTQDESVVEEGTVDIEVQISSLSEGTTEEIEIQMVDTLEEETIDDLDESDLQNEEDIALNLIVEISKCPTSCEQSKFVLIECRSVRIGTYKCLPLLHSKTAYFKIYISEKGILFTVPHSQFKHRLVKCAIPSDRITEIAGHFRARLPALFLKVESRYAAWIRNRLGLGKHPSERFYFGSAHGDDPLYKYIVFIPDEFQERVPHILKRIYKPIFQELDFKSVNSLLMSTIVPKESSVASMSK